MVKYVTADELEELIKTTDKTVFCDFFATWCGPCRMLAPVMEEISDKYETDGIFVKMDIDEEHNEKAAIKYGISSIPNVLVFKNGKVSANQLGFLPAEAFEKFVKNNL